jgi:TPR repeat protein
VSWSADFQKGLTAYDSGDYATALREWTPLAEQGYADAQYNLGVM